MFDIIDEDFFTTTTTTSIPLGVATEVYKEDNLILTEAVEEDNCIMRENINSCDIYLCRWLKNMLSLGFPCYIQ